MTERMTAAAYVASLRPKGEKRPAGRNAIRSGDFASRKEARRWAALLLMERAGQITDLRRQVRIDLIGQAGPILTPTGRPMAYVADFVYFESGARVVEDAKGHASDVYLIKRAILAAMGIAIREV